MTLQTEDSISLILCCFPAFKSCAGAQQPRAPGTEPGSVPWQSPDVQMGDRLIPACSSHCHSLSQPGVSPGVRAPAAASQDPAAEVLC